MAELEIARDKAVAALADPGRIRYGAEGTRVLGSSGPSRGDRL